MATMGVVFLILLGAGIFAVKRTKPSNLEIFARLVSNDNYRSLKGRVLLDGLPVENCRVWAIIIDNRGSKTCPDVKITGKDGAFACDSLEISSDSSDIAEVIIYAQKEIIKSDLKPIVKTGREFLKLTGQGSVKIVQLDMLAFVILGAIFFISLVVPFLPLNHRWKYLISMVWAVVFTVSMIMTILFALYFINEDFSSDSKDVLSLGFASIFQGKYFQGTSSEWILSLTSRTVFPESTSADKQVMSGFGAPLWVLLIAVIGAGLFTVSMVVSEIKDRPRFYLLEEASMSRTTIDLDSPVGKELMDFRKRLERITRHQFYILFSPIGAIFVYQLLVMAQAAGNSVTVALAAFGAGASLNLILDKAISIAQKAIETR